MSPRLIRSIGQVVSLSVGGEHACAVTATGHLYCWGRNDRAQTGLRSDPERCTEAAIPCVRQPQRVERIPLVVDVAAGRAHTCVLTRSVRCNAGGTTPRVRSARDRSAPPAQAVRTLPSSRSRWVDSAQPLASQRVETRTAAAPRTVRSPAGATTRKDELGDGNCTPAVPSPIQVDLR